MEIREYRTAGLYCSDCGAVGTATVSEEDHPYETGDVGRKVISCTPGFEVIPADGPSTDARIVCSKCKSVVYMRVEDSLTSPPAPDS
jgi:hypothetical protein